MADADRLTEVVTLRITAAERAQIEKYAAGGPLGPAIRELAVKALNPPAPPRMPLTGVTSTGWLSGETLTENHGGPLLVTCNHPGATYATRPGFIPSAA